MPSERLFPVVDPGPIFRHLRGSIQLDQLVCHPMVRREVCQDLCFDQRHGLTFLVADRAIKEGIALAQRAGTPSGIMITDIPAAQEWLRNGISFAGVGVDSSLLIRAADDLLAHFRTDPETPPTGNAY